MPKWKIRWNDSKTININELLQISVNVDRAIKVIKLQQLNKQEKQQKHVNLHAELQ